MLNILKRKYKRSDWLEGLMAAEIVQERFTYESSYNYYIFEIENKVFPEFSSGYKDYLDYYENNLKNL